MEEEANEANQAKAATTKGNLVNITSTLKAGTKTGGGG